MLSKTEIQKSIEALQPAPAGESIQQCGYRVARWMLSLVQDEHAEIAKTAALYDRLISGDAPTAAEWDNNHLALARALALALDRARALARDLARDLDRDLARDLDLDLAAMKILGARLSPSTKLDE